MEHPEYVDSLALINSTVGQAGWTEWGYQKVSSYSKANVGTVVLMNNKMQNEVMFNNY
jgi:hypothetical protein